jgi:prevent-host-death family protein
MCYMATRARVGVREIRQNLSVYLERVKRGEALEITERGHPVAVLAPVPERGSLVARLAADGRATTPTISPQDLGQPEAWPVQPGTPTLSQILEAMRNEETR